MTMLQALDRKEYQQDSVYSPPRRRVTEAEYWEKYYEYADDDIVYEWHNGYLEEKPVSDPVPTHELAALPVFPFPAFVPSTFQPFLTTF